MQFREQLIARKVFLGTVVLVLKERSGAAAANPIVGAATLRKMRKPAMFLEITHFAIASALQG
jgi:hypothetical protein